MSGKTRSSNHWIRVYEPGQKRQPSSILFEIDPGQALLRVIRRKRETVINLREYGLVPSRQPPGNKSS